MEIRSAAPFNAIPATEISLSFILAYTAVIYSP